MLKKVLFSGLLVLFGSFIYFSSQYLPHNDVKFREIKTTQGDIALGNLNSQISSLEKLINDEQVIKNQDQLTSFRSQWIDRSQTKMIYVGSFEDLHKAKALVEESDSNKDQLLINYAFHMMVHEFEQAERQIEKLSQFSGMKNSILGLKASLALARGENLHQAQKWMEELLGINPNYTNYTRLAGIQRERGKLQEALKTFAKSLEVYNNTSPLPPAYTHFQVGLLYGEYLDSPERAKKHYEMALRYLPKYVKARVHLAEILINQNKPKDALELMKPVEKNQDPEIPATLAKIYSRLGHKSRAHDYMKVATRRYQTLLKDFELAFGDHGAEFFMGIGNNPSLALQLALKNLENRKSDRAKDLVKKAKLANRHNNKTES